MTTVNYNDPFASAVNTAENSGKYYGQIQVSAAFVILTKGVGKSTYVEGNHDPKDRRTEVSFTLNPIEEMGTSNLVQRSMLSESREWSDIVWPSLRDGCSLNNLRELDNKYVKVQLVKNGRTWPDKKTGETREGTTLKFLAIYGNEKTCQEAYTKDGNATRLGTTSSNDDAGAIDMNPGAGSVDAEKEVAKKFLETLVKQSAGNQAMLNQMLSNMPMITKYYPVGSPEIAQMLQAA